MQFSGKKKVLWRWFFLNAVVLTIVSLALIVMGEINLIGLWAGASAYAMPEALFFNFAFRKTGALHLGQIHKGFTLGFMVKFFTAMLLLSLAFYFMVSPGQVLTGFLLSIVLSWYWLFRDLEQLTIKGEKKDER